MIAMRFALLALAAGLSGCASTMSGIGGHETYGCKAPEGVQCRSISGIYANAQNTAPAAVSERRMPPPPATYRAVAPTITAAVAAPPSPSTVTPPLRSPARVLRLWVAPWEDNDGDLHEASTVHVLIDTGRWLIEHVRASPRDPFRAVRPPTGATPATAKSTSDEAPGGDRLPALPGTPASATPPATVPR